MKAYAFYNDENKQALMVMDEGGFAFEESITGWCYCLNLRHGLAEWIHTDGRIYQDWLIGD